MLELLFGTRSNFIISMTVIMCTALYLPLIIGWVGALVTGFVTRWEVKKYPLIFLSPIYQAFRKGEEKQSDEWFILGVVLFALSWAAATLLSVIMWHTPIWAYITLGAVAGLLFTARFAYTLKSKFDKHMQQLHKSADAEEYKAKW